MNLRWLFGNFADPEFNLTRREQHSRVRSVRLHPLEGLPRNQPNCPECGATLHPPMKADKAE